MDKPLFDSDVDPKRIRRVADGLRRQGEFESARMLDAYADRIETREKAVPFAFTAQFEDGGFSGIWKDINDVVNWHQPPIPLYTHPAPADAERLAEALRAMLEVVDGREWPEHVRDAYEALTDHAAQARPPAASVTDEMVERARSAFVQADDGSTGITDAIRAALLVAQTQPPARTCSDERPCVNCFADQGGCLGPAPETVRQRKEQRAVEIAAAISTRHEFSRHESPLILDIVRATLTAQENPDD